MWQHVNSTSQEQLHTQWVCINSNLIISNFQLTLTDHKDWKRYIRDTDKIHTCDYSDHELDGNI